MTNPPSTGFSAQNIQICPVCNFQNRVGVLLCENCGAQLFGEHEAAAPAAGAVRCPNCGQMNRAGVLICEHCGTNLETGEQAKFGTATFPLLWAESKQAEAEDFQTDPLEHLPGGIPPLSNEEVRAIQSAGAARFEDDMILRLEIDGAPSAILVNPTNETVLGRRDPTTNAMPDIDLTNYAGYRMGVSRRHAAIRLQSRALDILDLGSSNGTYVNGVRLNAHQPHPLRDGDEVMLGKMALRVYFQTGARRVN